MPRVPQTDLNVDMKLEWRVFRAFPWHYSEFLLTRGGLSDIVMLVCLQIDTKKFTVESRAPHFSSREVSNDYI